MTTDSVCEYCKAKDKTIEDLKESFVKFSSCKVNPPTFIKYDSGEDRIKELNDELESIKRLIDRPIIKMAMRLCGSKV
jgi:hypothetical protein